MICPVDFQIYKRRGIHSPVLRVAFDPNRIRASCTLKIRMTVYNINTNTVTQSDTAENVTLRAIPTDGVQANEVNCHMQLLKANRRSILKTLVLARTHVQYSHEPSPLYM